MNPSPRRTESALLAMVAMVVLVAYTLAGLGTASTDSEPPAAYLVPFLVGMLALGLLGHLAVRRFAAHADPLLLPMALLLNGIGYVMIARLGGDVAGGGDLAGLQSTWTAVGMAGFVAVLVALPRIRVLFEYRYLIGLGGLVLLVLPLAPVIGREFHGARIWVSLGPVNFQPGEFAKLALAAFFAAYLADTHALLRARLELRDLVSIGAVWMASLGIMVLQRDLGSSLLFFALFLVVVWVASGRAALLWLGAGMFAGGAVLSWRLFGHVRQRVDIWLDPWADPAGDGYQITESAFAFAEGGLTGTGLGRGEPARIPLVESDFIFAAIGEELGLAGSTAVIMAFAVLVGAGLRIALRARRPFEKLFATGLSTVLGVQAFVIMAGVLRVAPLTGITLPFVSYGGSSLVANYALVALLIRMSHEQQADQAGPGVSEVLAGPVATGVSAKSVSPVLPARPAGPLWSVVSAGVVPRALLAAVGARLGGLGGLVASITGGRSARRRLSP